MLKKREQTTFCYCPKCDNELIGSNSFVSDEELITYRCSICDNITKWLFDTPVPILLYSNDEIYKNKEVNNE